MRTPDIFVTCYGSLYRLSPRRWKAYLQQVVAEGFANLNDFGTYVAEVEMEVADLTKAQAEYRLKG